MYMRNKLSKLKFEIENCKVLGKFVVSTLFLIIFLFEAANTRFLLISVKFAAVLICAK